MKRTFAVGFLTTGLLLFANACAAAEMGLGSFLRDSPAASEPGGKPDRSLAEAKDIITWNVLDRAYPLMSALWKTTSVAVCWEDLAQSTPADRAIVQQSIADSWQASSALTFVGWQKCAPNNRGIRIQVADANPRTLGLGKQVDGKKNGMLLDFTFNVWGPACKSSAKMRTGCIYSIAVHEFGHAIGFAHEQNRPDTPGDDCFDQRQGTNGNNTSLTPWDPTSVMNYCNPAYNNNGKLSDLDKFAVAKLYGAHP